MSGNTKYPANTISVSRGGGAITNLVRFWPDALKPLLEYPRKEVVFMTFEGESEDGGDRYAVAVLREQDSKTSGRVLSVGERGIGTSSTRSHVIPIGHYLLTEEVEYHDGMDWHFFTKMES